MHFSKKKIIFFCVLPFVLALVLILSWFCVLVLYLYEPKYTGDEKFIAERIYIDTERDDSFTIHEYKSLQKGDKIIAALEAFYSKNAHYPRSLDELVPVYIKKIPKASTYWLSELPRLKHAEFVYRVDNCNGWRTVENEDGTFERVFVGVEELEDSEIQDFFLRFRYNFDEEYNYFPSRGKWKYHLH